MGSLLSSSVLKMSSFIKSYSLFFEYLLDFLYHLDLSNLYLSYLDLSVYVIGKIDIIGVLQLLGTLFIMFIHTIYKYDKFSFMYLLLKYIRKIKFIFQTISKFFQFLSKILLPLSKFLKIIHQSLSKFLHKFNYPSLSKFLLILNYPPLSKYNLKSMPFKMDQLPDFIAVTATVALNTVLGNIDNQLGLLDNMSQGEQLEALQLMRDQLNNILKDNCAEANAKIAFTNNPAAWSGAEYNNIFRESSTFYASEEFERSKEMAKTLKLKIIELHKQGITNENSFKDPQGQILKRVQSDFPDAWKQPERRWNQGYSKRYPTNE